MSNCGQLFQLLSSSALEMFEDTNGVIQRNLDNAK